MVLEFDVQGVWRVHLSGYGSSFACWTDYIFYAYSYMTIENGVRFGGIRS